MKAGATSSLATTSDGGGHAGESGTWETIDVSSPKQTSYTRVMSDEQRPLGGGCRQRQLLTFHREASNTMLGLAIHMFSIAVEELNGRLLQDYITTAGGIFRLHSRRVPSQGVPQARPSRQLNVATQKVSSVPTRSVSHRKVSSTWSAGGYLSFKSLRSPISSTSAAMVARSSQNIPLHLRRQAHLLGASGVLQPGKDRGGQAGGAAHHPPSSKIRRSGRGSYAVTRTSSAGDEQQRSRVSTVHCVSSASSARGVSRRWTAVGAGVASANPDVRFRVAAGNSRNSVPPLQLSEVWKAPAIDRTRRMRADSSTRLSEPLRTRVCGSSRIIAAEDKRYQPLASLVSSRHRDSRVSAASAKLSSPMNGSPRFSMRASTTTSMASAVPLNTTPRYGTRATTGTPRSSYRPSGRRNVEAAPAVLPASASTTPARLQAFSHCGGHGLEGGTATGVLSTRRMGLLKGSTECSSADLRLEWSCTNSCAPSNGRLTSPNRRSTALMGANRSTLTGLHEWPIGKQTPLSRPYSPSATSRTTVPRSSRDTTRVAVLSSPLASNATIASDAVDESPSEFISRHFSSCRISPVLECVCATPGAVRISEAELRAIAEKNADGGSGAICAGLEEGDLLLECNGQVLSGAASLQEVLKKVLQRKEKTVLLRVLRGADSVLVCEKLVMDGSGTDGSDREASLL